MNGSKMEVKDRNGNTLSLVELVCKWKSACQKFLSKTGRCHDLEKSTRLSPNKVKHLQHVRQLRL
jgi:hypothetical protein